MHLEECAVSRTLTVVKPSIDDAELGKRLDRWRFRELLKEEHHKVTGR